MIIYLGNRRRWDRAQVSACHQGNIHTDWTCSWTVAAYLNNMQAESLIENITDCKFQFQICKLARKFLKYPWIPIKVNELLLWLPDEYITQSIAEE